MNHANTNLKTPEDLQVMLDVECYGLAPDAFVWEIGVTTWRENETAFVPRHAFSVFIDPRLSNSPISVDAVEWATDNCKSHETMLASVDGLTMHEMLADTVDGASKLLRLCRDGSGIWARGASFDFPKIQRALQLIDTATNDRAGSKTVGGTSFEKLWDQQYKKLRCMRDVLSYGFGGAKGYPKDSEASHSGMDDARAQAEYVFHAKKHIRNGIRCLAARGQRATSVDAMRYTQ